MEITILGLLIPAGLLVVFFASLGTGWEILRYGNEVDPLGRELEEENQREEEERAAA